jgi:hypothetical protein
VFLNFCPDHYEGGRYHFWAQAQFNCDKGDDDGWESDD